MMLHGSYLHRLAKVYADREKAIVDVMIIFLDCYAYKSRPTFEQFVLFVCDAEAMGYSTKGLYRTFASGKIPLDLDALIRRHTENWRPMALILEEL